MIRVVNLRKYEPKSNEVLIKVDRSTPLGNPFTLSNEKQRDEVCDRYQAYFDKMVVYSSTFKESLSKIVELHKTHDVALGCWCYPKRCHAETIKAYIERV